jgi:hypothetical protein
MAGPVVMSERSTVGRFDRLVPPEMAREQE